jgi:catechol-2,3-dioxygenase
MAYQRTPLDEMPAVPPVKFSHFVLRSTDPEALTKWYLTVLNAKVIFAGGSGGAGLTFDEEHHRLAIIGMPPRDVEKQLAIGDVFAQTDKRRQMSGLEHVSFTFDGLGQLFANYKRLKKEGILPVMCINHGPVMSMYYMDPEGNNVELQTDTMPMDQAIEFMYSEAFANNSIGAPYDPDELCDMYEQGVPLSKIAQFGWTKEELTS